MLRQLVVALAFLAVAAAPAPAQDAGIVDRAAGELRSNPVFVHPDAEAPITGAQAAELRDRIEQAGGRIYVAIVPGAALEEADDANGVVDRIAAELRRPGAYAVVVGRQFRARRVGAERADVARIATEAARDHGDEGVQGIAPALLDLVAGVADARGGAAGGTAEEEDGSPGVRFGIVAAIVAGVVGLFALRRRRRASAEFREVKEAAEEDLLALGDDIRALDLDVEMPNTDTRAREDYGRALSGYERASGAFARARRPADLEEVSAALEEGRYAMAAAKARLEGREPPEHRPPCFFDPRHGPSVRDVEWAPPGGEPRLVPACAADAIRVEEGEEPEARQVLVGGARTPYWNAGPAYGPWAGGFFGGATGALLPMLFMGSMLGSGFGLGGEGFGSEGGYGADEGGGPDEIGGGDFDTGGGGDFGGGDFGGGDFGGGDF